MYKYGLLLEKQTRYTLESVTIIQGTLGMNRKSFNQERTSKKSLKQGLYPSLQGNTAETAETLSKCLIRIS